MGCLNDRNELSLVSPGESRDNCRLLSVDDMRPSARAQIHAGLPSGSLEEAIDQLHKLARESVLPVCALPAKQYPDYSRATDRQPTHSDAAATSATGAGYELPDPRITA